MLRALMLGLRLARPVDRNGWARAVLVVAGVFVGVVCALTALSIPAVADAQAGRLALHRPALIGDGAFHAGIKPPMRVLYREDAVDGRVLTRVVVAGVTEAASRPAWLERYPSSGELVASPDLVRLIETEDTSVAGRFPQTVIQVLGPDALVSPDQLVAILGVESAELPVGESSAAAASGLGTGDIEQPGLDPRALRVLLLGASVFLLVPTMVLVATSARLSARTRQRRLAALRLVGLRPRRVALVNAVEIGVLSVLGAVGGAATWNVLVPLSERVGLASLHWYAEDVSVSLLAQLGIAVVVATSAVLVSVAGSAGAIANPLAERRSVLGAPAGPTRRVFRVAPLAGGVALLIASVALPSASTGWFVMFFAGIVLSVVGMYGAIPILARRLGLLISRRARQPASLLAARRLAHDPNGAARATIGMLSVVLVAGFGQTMVVALDWAINRNSPIDHGELAQFSVRNMTSDPSVVAPGEVSRALPIVELGTWQESTTALVADCEQLAAVASTLGSCEGTSVQPINFDREKPEEFAALSAGEVVRFEYSSVGGGSSGAADFVVPPTLLPDGMPATHRWLVSVDRDSIDSAINLILGDTPAAQISGIPSVDRGRLITTYSTLVLAGTLAAVVVSFSSSLAALADRALERRRTSNQLIALGVPASTLRKAEALWIGVPLFTGIGLAMTVVSLAAVAYLRIGEATFDLPLRSLLLTFGIGVVASLAATTVAVAATPSSPGDRISSDAL